MMNTDVITIFDYIKGYELERYKKFVYIRRDAWTIATAKRLDDGQVQITWHEEIYHELKPHIVEAVRACYQVDITEANN